MKRRSFLHTSTWGLVGLGLPIGVLSTVGQQPSTVHHWLGQLTTALGARRRTALWGQPEALRMQIHQTNAFLAPRGYVSHDSSLYFYAGQGGSCFYTLVLRRAAAGLTDLLVPVLGRRPNGSWQQLVVLTGYQIEALTRAATALVEQQLPLHELLMPNGPAVGAGDTFPTMRGSISIETRLQHGLARTQMVVRSGQEVIHSENFASGHCLSTSPAIQAAALQA